MNSSSTCLVLKRYEVYTFERIWVQGKVAFIYVTFYTSHIPHISHLPPSLSEKADIKGLKA